MYAFVSTPTVERDLAMFTFKGSTTKTVYANEDAIQYVFVAESPLSEILGAAAKAIGFNTKKTYVAVCGLGSPVPAMEPFSHFSMCTIAVTCDNEDAPLDLVYLNPDAIVGILPHPTDENKALVVFADSTHLRLTVKAEELHEKLTAKEDSVPVSQS